MEKTRYSGLQTLVLAGSLVAGAIGLAGCMAGPKQWMEFSHDPFGILADHEKEFQEQKRQREHYELLNALQGQGNTAPQEQVPRGVTLYLTDREDDKAGITRKTKFKRGEKIYSKAIINVGYVEKIENYAENVETGENISGGKIINKPFGSPESGIIYMSSGALDATHVRTIAKIVRMHWRVNGEEVGSHIFEVE